MGDRNRGVDAFRVKVKTWTAALVDAEQSRSDTLILAAGNAVIAALRGLNDAERRCEGQQQPPPPVAAPVPAVPALREEADPARRSRIPNREPMRPVGMTPEDTVERLQAVVMPRLSSDVVVVFSSLGAPYWQRRKPVKQVISFLAKEGDRRGLWRYYPAGSDGGDHPFITRIDSTAFPPSRYAANLDRLRRLNEPEGQQQPPPPVAAHVPAVPALREADPARRSRSPNRERMRPEGMTPEDTVERLQAVVMPLLSADVVVLMSSLGAPYWQGRKAVKQVISFLAEEGDRRGLWRFYPAGSDGGDHPFITRINSTAFPPSLYAVNLDRLRRLKEAERRCEGQQQPMPPATTTAPVLPEESATTAATRRSRSPQRKRRRSPSTSSEDSRRKSKRRGRSRGRDRKNRNRSSSSSSETRDDDRDQRRRHRDRNRRSSGDARDEDGTGAPLAMITSHREEQSLLAETTGSPFQPGQVALSKPHRSIDTDLAGGVLLSAIPGGPRHPLDTLVNVCHYIQTIAKGPTKQYLLLSWLCQCPPQQTVLLALSDLSMDSSQQVLCIRGRGYPVSGYTMAIVFTSKGLHHPPEERYPRVGVPYFSTKASERIMRELQSTSLFDEGAFHNLSRAFNGKDPFLMMIPAKACTASAAPLTSVSTDGKPIDGATPCIDGETNLPEAVGHSLHGLDPQAALTRVARPDRPPPAVRPVATEEPSTVPNGVPHESATATGCAVADAVLTKIRNWICSLSSDPCLQAALLLSWICQCDPHTLVAELHSKDVSTMGPTTIRVVNRAYTVSQFTMDAVFNKTLVTRTTKNVPYFKRGKMYLALQLAQNCAPYSYNTFLEYSRAFNGVDPFLESQAPSGLDVVPSTSNAATVANPLCEDKAEGAS